VRDWQKDDYRKEILLKPLAQSIVVNQRVKDGQNVAAVFDDPLQHRTQSRLARRFTVPLGEDRRRNLNVPAKFVGGMPAKKEAVEKCRLALREFKIPPRFHRGFRKHVELSRHNKKSQFTGFFAAVKPE